MEELMRQTAGLFGLALVFIVTSGWAMSATEPAAPAGSVPEFSERQLDWGQRQTLAQVRSTKCSSAAGLCYTPTAYPVGTPCSCGGYGRVIIP
jgi:hypothetical protein